jgi:hypothetical protein
LGGQSDDRTAPLHMPKHGELCIALGPYRTGGAAHVHVLVSR